MDVFISHWRLGQRIKKLKNTAVPCFQDRICGAMNSLASEVIINWPRAVRTSRSYCNGGAAWKLHGFSTELKWNSAGVWIRSIDLQIYHYGIGKFLQFLSSISLLTFLFILGPTCFNTELLLDRELFGKWRHNKLPRATHTARRVALDHMAAVHGNRHYFN